MAVPQYSVPEQYRALDVPVEQSVFYEQFLKMPASISADVQEELRKEARTVIQEDVIQSFKDLGKTTDKGVLHIPVRNRGR